MEEMILVVGVIWLIVSFVVGLNFAKDQERVFERISDAFNKVLAFVVGFGFSLWAGAFAIGLLAAGGSKSGEAIIVVLLAYPLFLLFGILSIGALANFVDMRKSLHLIAEDSVHIRKATLTTATRPIPSERVSSDSHGFTAKAFKNTAPLSDTPEMTDEEKVAVARKVAEEAIRKSKASAMDAEDEETPTTP